MKKEDLINEEGIAYGEPQPEKEQIELPDWAEEMIQEDQRAQEDPLARPDYFFYRDREEKFERKNDRYIN